MDMDDHGFSKKFEWVEDKFGVSWQLNLPYDNQKFNESGKDSS